MKIPALVSLFAAAAMLAMVSGDAKAPAEGGYFLVPLQVRPNHRGQTFDPRVRQSNGTSTNWSGYAVETSLSSPQTDSVTDVQGSWTVPATTAGTASRTYSSSWVGIDGYSDGTVEQIGTEQDWTSGQAKYYAWFEMYPKRSYLISGFPVSPGDAITTEVKYAGNGAYVLSITNTTRGASFSTTQRAPKAKNTSAEWVVEAPSSGGVLPLANFGTTTLTGCTAVLNGHSGTIGDTAWQNDAITMSSGSTVKAQPSSLSTDGSEFSVTWSHE